MTLYDMRAFYRFLESAEERELEMRRDRLVAFLAVVDQEPVRSDARYLLRKIEEEMLARISRP
jgi:hypothetical protein